MLVSSGQDVVDGQRESVPNVTRITALVRNRKKKEHVNFLLVTYHCQFDCPPTQGVPILGPGCSLRPRCWKRPQTLIPPPDPDLKTEKEMGTQTTEAPELLVKTMTLYN